MCRLKIDFPTFEEILNKDVEIPDVLASDFSLVEKGNRYTRRKANAKHRKTDRQHGKYNAERDYHLYNNNGVATRKMAQKANEHLKNYEEDNMATENMFVNWQAVADDLGFENAQLQLDYTKATDSLVQATDSLVQATEMVEHLTQANANLKADLKGTEETLAAARREIEELRQSLNEALYALGRAKAELNISVVEDDQRFIGVSDSVNAKVDEIFPVIGLEQGITTVDLYNRESFRSTVEGNRNGKQYVVTFETRVSYTTEMIGMEEIEEIEIFPDCEEDFPF